MSFVFEFCVRDVAHLRLMLKHQTRRWKRSKDRLLREDQSKIPNDKLKETITESRLIKRIDNVRLKARLPTKFHEGA